MMRNRFKAVCALLICAVMVLEMIPAGSLMGAGWFRNPLALWANAAENVTYGAGDMVEFGSYPQSEVTDAALRSSLSALTPDANGDVTLDGARYRLYKSTWYAFEPIRWRVLRAGSDGYYLLAERLIECMPYHSENASITWENCSLRTWLNSNFYDVAFSDSEKDMILQQNVVNDSVPGYSTSGGNNTQDRVYLLSYNEASSSEFGFMSATREDTARFSTPTEYTIARGIRTSKEGSIGSKVLVGAWWLRSAGQSQNEASDCSRPGDLNHGYTCTVDTADMGVRPVINVSVDFDPSIKMGSFPQREVKDAALCSVLSEMQQDAHGDVTLDGERYRSYQSKWYRFDPIRWRVLQADGSGYILLAENLIECMPYHERKENITWENCTLRAWLNNEFYNTAFTDAEQGKIQLQDVVNNPVPGYSTVAGNNTQDYVWLLSYSEASSSKFGFASPTTLDKSRYATPSEYTLARGSRTSTYDGKVVGIWWLRSPGQAQNEASDCSRPGDLNKGGTSAVNVQTQCVRPAIKVAAIPENSSGQIRIRVSEDGTQNPYNGTLIKLKGLSDETKYTGFVTDKPTVTFADLNKNQAYSAVLVSQGGVEYGKIDVIQFGQSNVAQAAFENISPRLTQAVVVQTPDGETLADGYTVNWSFADSGEYIGSGNSVSDVTKGTKLSCEIVLSDELLHEYTAPAKQTVTVAADAAPKTVTLSAIPKITITGTVTDTAGDPISGAAVTFVQPVSERVSFNVTEATNADGVFSAEIAALPAEVTVSKFNYAAQTLQKTFSDGENAEFTLVYVPGAHFSMQVKGANCDGTTFSFDAGNNLTYSVRNVTTGTDITDFAIEYPQILIPEAEISAGDTIRFTASDKSGEYISASAEVVYDAAVETTNVALQLVQKGRFHMTASAAANEKNMAVLFDASGKFAGTADFDAMTATSGNLAAGAYTVVLCGRSPILYCLTDLSDLASFNLTEGTDYIRVSGTITNGEITELADFSIPAMDESKFTMVSTSESAVSVAQAEVSLGQYVSVRAALELTEKYKSAVSGAVMHISVPDDCAVVEGSVTVDSVAVSNAQLQNGVLSVPMPAGSGTVRFYLRPTVGGRTSNIYAYASLTISGSTAEQPVGSTRFTVSSIKLNAPAVTSKKTITVTGKTVARSTLEFFDNNTSVGTATANAAGSFSAQFMLYRPSSVANHSIHAVVTTPDGHTYESDNTTVAYDAGAVEVSKVLMRNKGDRHTNTWDKWQTTVFDFENPSSKVPSYRFWAARYPTISFEVFFTENDPDLVKNVYVATVGTNGEVIRVPVEYNETSGTWKGSYDYDDYTAPCFVDVAFDLVDGSEKSGVGHAPSADVTAQDYTYTPHTDTTVYAEPTDSTPFALTEIYPDKGSDGKVTIRLTGTMLEANAKAVLTNGAVTVEASEIFYMNHQRAYATFDLSGAPDSMYSLTVTCGDKQATRDNCFMLNRALPHGKLETTVEISDDVIAGDVHTGTVRIANTGYTDVTAPTLYLSAEKLLVGESAETLQDGLMFFCASDNGLPGTLLAAESSGYTFCYAATELGGYNLHALNVGALNYKIFNKNTPTADSTADEIIENNWIDLMGERSYPYAKSIAGMANYLAQFGNTQPTLEDIRNAWLFNAKAALTGSTILSATDLVSVDVALSRSLPTSIEARAETGLFGRGWVTSYDTRAVVEETDGVTTIRVESPISLITFINQEGIYKERNYGLSTATVDGGAVTVTDRDGSVTAFDANGRLASVTDNLGNGVTLTWSGDTLTAIGSTNGDRITLTYADGNIVSATSELTGDTVTYTYSGDNLASVTTKYGTTAYTYDTESVGAKRGALIAATYAEGSTLHFEYDRFGRPETQYAGDHAEEIHITYGRYNDVTVTDADGNSARYCYDGNGLAARAVDSSGVATDTDYNELGLALRTRIGNETAAEYTYNSTFDVTAQTDAAGEVVRYTYDALGNITSVTDQGGKTMTYQRDAKGQLTKLVYPDGSFEAYTYDAKGNALTYTNRKGETASYTYDAFSRRTRAEYADGTVIEYAYDARGNVTQITDGSGVTAVMYNANGDMTSVTYPGGKTVSYTYDAFGRTASVTDSAGVETRYVYDSLGRLQKLTDGNGAAISTYTYTPGGALARQDNANGTYTTYAYGNGLLQSIGNFAADGSELACFAYTYDSRGLIDTMTESDGTWRYAYDKLGQLTGATAPDGTVTQYAYDLSGNRTAVTVGSETTAYTANSLNQYTQVGSASLACDANGNLISRTDAAGTTTFEYDCRDRLVKVTAPDGVTEYGYDAFGGRSRVTANGVTTEYVNTPTGYGYTLTSYTGGTATSYIQGDGLTAQVSGGQAYFYHYNHLGSAAAITGADGAAVNTYRYDQEGTVTAQTGTLANPFTYVGQYGIMDDTDGLWYMRARYVSKETDSFVTVDPIGQIGGINIYRYVDNNSVNLLDMTGNDSRRAPTVNHGAHSKAIAEIWDDSDGSEYVSVARGTEENIDIYRQADRFVKPFNTADIATNPFNSLLNIFLGLIPNMPDSSGPSDIQYYGTKDPDGTFNKKMQENARQREKMYNNNGLEGNPMGGAAPINPDDAIFNDDDGSGGSGGGGNGGGGKGRWLPGNPIKDPSGYVCEAVPSNRIEGVTTTCYYSAYPDGRDAVVWNAEEYDQVNPLVTDGDGRYEWYVPDGWWQVRYEKDGYVTAYSAWLPVPPAQTEVNISLDVMASPEVEYVQWTQHGIEMQFSRYMDITSVNADTVTLTQNGVALRGKFYPVDAEASFNDADVSYATKFVFVPYNCFPTGVVTVQIDGARNYVGTPLDEAYTVTLQPGANIPSFTVEGNAALAAGATATLHLQFPASAAGSQIRVTDFDPDVLSVSSETLTVAADGTASLTVTALQDGATSIQFELADSRATAETQIVVGDGTQTVSAVLPGIENGMAVPAGTTLPLTCGTTGAAIYYTTDGSAPADADNEARAVYTEPIALTDGMTIRACAVKDGMADSASAAFSYTVYPNIPVESFTLDSTHAVLIPGQSVTLTATFTPEDATNQRFTYSTDDSSVASITQAGVLTAVADGTTQITATAEDFALPQTVSVQVFSGITLADGAPYTLSGGTLTIADEDTAEQTVLQAFVNDGIEVVTDNAEAELAERVGTGAQLVIRDANGDVLDSVTAVVRGDLDGSGTVTIRDRQLLEQSLEGGVTLTEAQTAAADYNADGTVDEQDLQALENRLLDFNQTFTAMTRTQRYTANLEVENFTGVNVNRFPVRIKLTDGEDVSSLRFALQYDPALEQAVDCTASSGTVRFSVDEDAGRIIVIAVNPDGFDADTVFTVSFEPLQENYEAHSMTLTGNSFDVLTADGEICPITMYPGTVSSGFVVTFDANGGDCSAPYKVLAEGTTAYGELPAPTRKGYSFDGWFTAQTDGTQVTDETQIASAEDHTLWAHWTADAPSDYMTVTIDDGIGVNFWLDLDNEARKNVESVTATYKDFSGQTITQTIAKSELTAQDDRYKLTVRIAPAQLADEISVVVGDAELSNSVRSYCEELIDGDFTDEVKAVANALEQYAQAANVVFGYSADVIADISDLRKDAVTAYTGAVFTDGTGEVTGASFMALTKPEFRFYTANIDEQTAINYNEAGVCAVMDSGSDTLNALFVKKADGQVLIEVTGVTAENMDKTITVTVSGLGTITFNGNAFARAMASSSNAQQSDLGAVLYNYGVAARECFGA